MFHFDQRDHPQSPRLPWLGTCADETKRSENPHYSALGPVDFDAAGRSRRSDRERFPEVLPRASGHEIAAIGFSGARAGQMADHSRLAAGCLATVRLLDFSRTPDRPGPQAQIGASEVQNEELRRLRVTAGAARDQSSATSACTENIRSASVHDERTDQPDPRASAVKRSRLYL